jgi:hypothetical protein
LAVDQENYRLTAVPSINANLADAVKEGNLDSGVSEVVKDP